VLGTVYRPRVERGAMLQHAQVTFGVQSRCTIFPAVGHAVSDAMAWDKGLTKVARKEH
jgi:hypothetical protein